MTSAIFARLWRWFGPVAGALMALAVMAGVFSDASWPAWTFGVGLAAAVVAVASLVTHLTLRAKATIEDVLDGDDDAPPGQPPGGPTFRRKP